MSPLSVCSRKCVNLIAYKPFSYTIQPPQHHVYVWVHCIPYNRRNRQCCDINTHALPPRACATLCGMRKHTKKTHTRLGNESTCPHGVVSWYNSVSMRWVRVRSVVFFASNVYGCFARHHIRKCACVSLHVLQTPNGEVIFVFIVFARLCG